MAQGLRFALAGGIVMLVYLLSTLALATVFGLPFQLALAIGFCLGLTMHFTLQRVFVWTHRERFALPLHHQLARYLLAAGTQYGITALSVALLPAALGLPTQVVYVATAMLCASANFLLFRNGVFHAAAPEVGPALKPT
jgi:putative flippase GtrA